MISVPREALLHRLHDRGEVARLTTAQNAREQAASLTVRDNRLARYFGLFGSLGLLWEHLATSGAKSDVIFLLGDPDFL